MDPIYERYQGKPDRIRSVELLKRFSETLTNEAREILAIEPQRKLAGIISEKGTRTWKILRTHFTQTTGIEELPELFVGTVDRSTVERSFWECTPRDYAERMLALANQTPPYLLVICDLESGTRSMATPIYSSGPDIDEST